LNTKKSTQIETDPSFSDCPMWTRSYSIDFVPIPPVWASRQEIWLDKQADMPTSLHVD